MLPCLRPFLLLSTLLAVSAQAAPAAERPASPPRRNVLFIMTDDLNCNLGLYGHPLVQSPSIDRLGAAGLTFDNAFCNYPLCGPSRASFLTGLYPEQNGVTRLRRLFRHYVPDVVTLPQHFRNHGYRVARVGKLFHYDNPTGVGSNGHDDPDSWQIRVNPIGRDRAEEDKIFSLIPGNFGATLSWLAAEGADAEQTDGMVADESIKLLREFKNSGQPFFLGVGFYRPHTPFVAPKNYFDWYDPHAIQLPRHPANYLESLPAPAARSLRAFKHQIDLPDSTRRAAIHAYYASISFVDAQVGRVLQALDALGLRDNTIILFSSDHGYHMGEHGHFQKSTLFEDADRVPLILSAPGMKTAGRRTRALVEMIDFYRTLSDLAGLPPPPAYVQGISLAPLLIRPDLPLRPTAITQFGEGYTLRTARYRYTRWPRAEGLQEELYDRLNDPAEMVNLATDPAYADVLASLRPIWDQRVTATSTPVPGLAFTPPADSDNGVTKEQYLELEAAGRLPRKGPNP